MKKLNQKLGVTVEVVYEDESGYLIQQGAYRYWTEHKHLYTEIKEPRKFTAWINLYDKGEGGLRDGGVIFRDRGNALKSAVTKGYIDTIEITYTEKV